MKGILLFVSSTQISKKACPFNNLGVRWENEYKYKKHFLSFLIFSLIEIVNWRILLNILSPINR